MNLILLSISVFILILVVINYQNNKKEKNYDLIYNKKIIKQDITDTGYVKNEMTNITTTSRYIFIPIIENKK